MTTNRNTNRNTNIDPETAAAIERLKRDRGFAEQLMQSGDGQRLMRMLSGGDGGMALNQATQSAAAGDTRALAGMLRNLMHNRDAAAAMERISQSARKNPRDP